MKVAATMTVAALVALAAGTAAAQSPDNDEGFYIGGGFGQFNVKVDDVDDTDEAIQRIDDDDRSWKLFAGYRFNPYFALEAAYIDFGGPEDRDDFSADGSSGDYSVELSGFAPYLIGTYPIGPVDLFGKVGYYFYDVDLRADFDDLGDDVFQSSNSDEDLLYGFGLGMTFVERLNARLEYEKIDSDVIEDADAMWLSASWRF